jgi:hypothetical protein
MGHGYLMLSLAYLQVAIDAESGRPLRGQGRQVRAPEGPPAEIAKTADERRKARLEDKRILVALYA